MSRTRQAQTTALDRDRFLHRETFAMIGKLIRDRFICDDDGWIDLVTGERLRAPADPERTPVRSDARAFVEPLVALATSPNVGVRVAEMATDGDLRGLAEESARALHASGFL